MPYGTVNADLVVGTNGGKISPENTFGFRNRIINGAMVIDQRNSGASVATSSGTSVYTLDRWQAVYSQVNKFTVQQNAGSVTPPSGFTNYLGITSSSPYSVGASELFNLVQSIEGFNTADLGWGTASAQSVNLSFWVRSSLTGTFGVTFNNEAANRFYGATYTVSTANTWEQKTITIPGDTTGTWSKTNGVGIAIRFGLGVGSSVSGSAGSWGGTTIWGVTGATSVVGTNGATFYITGVQLEVGSNATSFDYRPYGTELALCQRYYVKAQVVALTTANNNSISLPVPMRTTPTISVLSVGSGSGVTYSTTGVTYLLAQSFIYQVSANSAIAIANIETTGAEL